MIGLIVWLLQIYNFIILARIIISYFPNIDPNNPLVQALYQVTEPVLAPVRTALQRQFGMQPFDFSPLVVFIGIIILRTLLLSFA